MHGAESVSRELVPTRRWVKCPTCEGEGTVDDVNPCPRCLGNATLNAADERRDQECGVGGEVVDIYEPGGLLDRAIDVYEAEYRRILPGRTRDYTEHIDAVASALHAVIALAVTADVGQTTDVPLNKQTTLEEAVDYANHFMRETQAARTEIERLTKLLAWCEAHYESHASDDYGRWKAQSCET